MINNSKRKKFFLSLSLRRNHPASACVAIIKLVGKLSSTTTTTPSTTTTNYHLTPPPPTPPITSATTSSNSKHPPFH